MISPDQIRAARAMLGWSTSILAKKTGITVNGLNKIERGHVVAQRETLDRIKRTFEDYGVEFLPGFGLREKNETVTLKKGIMSNNLLALDVYNTLRQTGGELMIIADETVSSRNLDPDLMRSQFAKRKQANITHRLLVPPRNAELFTEIKSFYRELAPEYVPPCPLFIYGNKIALLIPEYDPKVLFVNNEKLANAAKGLFNFVWDHATTTIPKASSAFLPRSTPSKSTTLSGNISAEQIRAARAFLDWSTADLAAQTGITVNGINKIERNHVSPHNETLSILQKTFEDSGIEFLPSSGLKRKEHFVLVWEGENACNQLFDDIYLHMRDTGGEVLVSGITETNCTGCVGRQQLQNHIARLEECNVFERVLVRQGDSNFIGPLETYHWMDDAYFSPETICIYADRIALVTWDPESVIIFDDPRMAESMKKLFDFVWDHTSAIPT